MLRKNRFGFVLVAACLAAGCGSDGDAAVDTGDEDGADDSFVSGGKTDIAGIEEGSAEACGVLRVANDATMEELDGPVALSSLAAKNIAAYRKGADGALGTADDGYFDSLTELDAIKYVGPKTFVRMAGYAGKQGYKCVDVDLQLLAFADLHGQLDPVPVANVGNVGGVAALRAYFVADRVANPRSLLLSAGDSFGASPALAALFDEKPVVEALNLMGVDAEAPGNHAFDRGVGPLQQLIELASYPFVSANLTKVADNMACPTKAAQQCIAPYRTMWVGGVKVAVVGLITTELASLLKPGALGTIEAIDPVAPALQARDKAEKEGARVFVALTHIGGSPGPNGPEGPLVELAKQLNGFDVVLGGHTHTALNAEVGGRLVVENQSQGGTYSRAVLKYNFASKAVVARSAETRVPNADQIAPDPAMVELLKPYRVEASKLLDAPIGVATGVFERGNNIERLQEVALGNLLADAVRERYGADVAVVNGGGLRAALPSSYAPADLLLRRPAAGYQPGPPFDLVVGDVYSVLPFGNDVAVCEVTGELLWKVAEHGVEALPAAKGFFPQISGFKFTFDAAAPPLSRVKAITLSNGTPIGKDGTAYTLATSDFMYLGGDGYAMLAGTKGAIRDRMAEVLVDYIKAKATISPLVEGRIVAQ